MIERMQTVTTTALAERAGFEVPSFAKAQPDYVLVYDDNDLVCWGPASERDKVLALAKVYA